MSNFEMIGANERNSLLASLSSKEISFDENVLNQSIESKSSECEQTQENQNKFDFKDSVLSDEQLNSSIEKPEQLSSVEKEYIQERTGWSDNVVDSIKNMEEAKVYMDANLKEVEGNLLRQDIDWEQKIPENRIERMRSIYGDETADKWKDKTNLDLIKEGKAPYGLDGERINLHHIGQKSDSPLAELTDTEHKVNDGILHDKTKDSEIDRTVFKAERKEHWQSRYNQLQTI